MTLLRCFVFCTQTEYLGTWPNLIFLSRWPSIICGIRLVWMTPCSPTLVCRKRCTAYQMQNVITLLQVWVCDPPNVSLIQYSSYCVRHCPTGFHLVGYSFFWHMETIFMKDWVPTNRRCQNGELNPGPEKHHNIKLSRQFEYHGDHLSWWSSIVILDWNARDKGSIPCWRIELFCLSESTLTFISHIFFIRND